MIVKSLVTFKGGHMTKNFVFGGAREALSNSEMAYGYQITSYLIETGGEVVLIDTGFPEHIVGAPPNNALGVYIGNRVSTFKKALNDAGYETGDIDKIILTHKDVDHSGIIGLFPQAEIILSKVEYDRMSYITDNMTPINLNTGSFRGFHGAYEVLPNLHFVQGYGHTEGHGLVIAYDEDKTLYYMFAGDATLTDEALLEGDVMLIHENTKAAKETLENIRKFVGSHPTIYLSSHAPEAVNSLKEEREIKL